MLLFLGSLSLFSIFILIAIYWADLLKKVGSLVFLFLHRVGNVKALVLIGRAVLWESPVL